MNPKPEQLERIVAYLDGELSPEESAQVEQRLASDEQFRQELQSAERAWSALDQLPMAQVDEEFAHTTMEMVVETARQDIEQQTIALPVQKRKRNTATGMMIACTLLLATLATRVILEGPNRSLVTDLPVIHNVDIYSQVENIEYLRLLQTKLGDDVATYSLNPQGLTHQVEEFEQLVDVDRREPWLEAMEESEQTSLRGKEGRFRELPPQKQQALRELNEAIAADGQREQLVQTMYVYQQWLNELELSEQYKLRVLPSEERANTAARKIRRSASDQQFNGDQQFKLSEEELRSLFREVLLFVAKMRRAQQPQFEREIQRMSATERMEFFLKPGEDQIRRVFNLLRREAPEKFEELNGVVANALPPQVSEAFQALNDREKMEEMRKWSWELREQFEAGRNEGRRRGSAGEPTEVELQNFFVEELEPDQKERLLSLPRDQMHQQLVRLLQGKRRGRSWDGPPRRNDRRRGSNDGPPPEGPGRGPRDDDGRWRDRQGPPPRDGRGPRRFFEGGPEGPPPPLDGPPPEFGPPGEFGPPRGRGPRQLEDREDRPRRRRFEGNFRREAPPATESTDSEKDSVAGEE